MSNLKTEITKLADNTILSNAEIARLCNCSPKTVYKYAGNTCTVHILLHILKITSFR